MGAGVMEKNTIAKYAPIGSLIVIFAVAMCGMTAYITGSIHGVETRLNARIDGLGARIECLEKDVAIIKTVLLMKGVMPAELAANEPPK
jgi:hypothetical protein